MIENWQLMSNKICSSWLLFLTLDLLSVSYGSKSDVESHLEMGRDFVSRGQLQDALSHYHAAVEGDPENYLTYFKRGTVYLALGKSKFALFDFHKVLELKPDFHSARFQRGLVLMKQGEIEQAKIDFYHVHTTNSEYSPDASDHYSKLNDLQYEIDSAEYYYENDDYDSAVLLLNKVIEVCPWSSKLRELRSKCHLARGDTHAAIMDLKSNTKLLPDNTDGYYTLSTLHYRLGNLQDALKEVRECLKLDPDHKQCFPHYKKTKKVEKYLNDAEEAVNNKKYAECVENANKSLRTEDKEPMVVFTAKRKLCHCLLHNHQFSESLQYCQEALQIKQDPDIYCDKADVYIATDMFDEAIREYNKALNLESDFTRAVNGLKRAQKLQKQSEKRDYYKILGVSRTASKQEIIKAYRKAAMKWHPDNYHGDEKEMAQKKFVDVAAAKEVLTDPEKRQKFDNGEDPLDPESGQHQGFNPFQHFQHFHSSPFHFKFHFN